MRYDEGKVALRDHNTVDEAWEFLILKDDMFKYTLDDFVEECDSHRRIYQGDIHLITIAFRKGAVQIIFPWHFLDGSFVQFDHAEYVYGGVQFREDYNHRRQRDIALYRLLAAHISHDPAAIVMEYDY